MRNGHLSPLSGHRYRTATYLARNCASKHRHTYELYHYLAEDGIISEERGNPHVYVEEHPEHKPHKELEKLNRLTPPPQHQNLCNYQDYIHDIGVTAYCQSGSQTASPAWVKAIGIEEMIPLPRFEEHTKQPRRS